MYDESIICDNINGKNKMNGNVYYGENKKTNKQNIDSKTSK